MRIYLAPMEGVMDHPMRAFYARLGGIDLAVTEFLRISESRLPDACFLACCPEIERPLAIPVRLQLLGSDPERLAEHAARAAALGAIGIDLNFGCPAKTVNKSRGGACLLQEPELLYRIARAVRRAVAPEIAVTAKMRLGYKDRDDYHETAPALEAGGISELVVHGRSKEDGYQPPAYWHLIAKVRECVSIPVIANGEIWTVEDALRCQAESGCRDIMIGRGLLARPDLALAIRARWAGEDYRAQSFHTLLPGIWNYHLQTLETGSAKSLGNRLKQWLSYLQYTYADAKVLFEQIKRHREQPLFEAAYQTMLHKTASQPESPAALHTPSARP
jgi:tRNA-dihydrouridine synthase C